MKFLLVIVSLLATVTIGLAGGSDCGGIGGTYEVDAKPKKIIVQT